MLAIHDQSTHQMHDRLKTICMGLGLVRLLQELGLAEEARKTLSSLDIGFESFTEESDKPNQNPCKADRLKGVSKGFALMALSESLEFGQSPN
jgi:hypothetical protein